MSKIRYRDLTDREKKAICDGCGPKGTRWLNVPEFIFTDACDHHDFNYWLGCTEADRRKADGQFGRQMRKEAWEVSGKVKGRFKRYLTRAHYLLWAQTYYLGVRIGGGAFFHYAEHERTRADLKEEVKARLAG